MTSEHTPKRHPNLADGFLEEQIENLLGGIRALREVVDRHCTALYIDGVDVTGLRGETERLFASILPQDEMKTPPWAGEETHEGEAEGSPADGGKPNGAAE